MELRRGRNPAAGSPDHGRGTVSPLLLATAAGHIAVVAVALFPFAVLARAGVDVVRDWPPSTLPGMLLAGFALLCGAFFFAYSVRYYTATAVVLGAALYRHLRHGTRSSDLAAHGNGVSRIAHAGNAAGTEWRYGTPFVCIQIATYNEERVIERLLECCDKLDYPAYQVILVDDSNDGSAEILERWKSNPKFTIIRRPDRTGFKGGALREALEFMDPRTEYVCIFDADAMPFPDSIQQLLPHFFVNGGSNPVRRREDVAAVQSYQWHVLNKRESWLTEAVRVEYAGSYMVERPFQDVFGAMKMIAGTAYMIRADRLREMGWGTSITEDWELTCRLYAKGYKVVYTPYGETPAECVGTFRRLVKQRMRWAEGHSFNVRKHFRALMRSPHLTLTEKIEFGYYATYYLQAVVFVLGTAAWGISELLLHAHLPQWTALLGWSLVGVNLTSIPLMNAAGLLLEGADRRDYGGLFGSILLSTALVPFQGWAAVKGLFEREEGTWNRTPKTGHVTDETEHLRQRGWLGAWLKEARRRRARAHPETLGEPLANPPTATPRAADGADAEVADAGTPPAKPKRRRRGSDGAPPVAKAATLGAVSGTALAFLVAAMAVSAASPAMFISGSPSSVNANDGILGPAGGTSRTLVALIGGTASATFVTTESYSGGDLAAGSYGLNVPYTISGCGLVVTECQLKAEFGVCDATCSTASMRPAITFGPTPASLLGGTFSQTASTSQDPLTGCPCHLYLTISLIDAPFPLGVAGILVLQPTGSVTPPPVVAPSRLVALVALGAVLAPLGARHLSRRRRAC